MSFSSRDVVRPVVALLIVLASSAGCDASVEIEPTGGGGSGACCAEEPMCTLDVPEVDECVTDDCFSVESCCIVKLCDPGCFPPVCEITEHQVDSCEGSTAPDCHALTNCNNTVYCESEAMCGELPACDAGDQQETSGVCPSDEDCYQAALCGTIILCLDFGLQHGCAPSAPRAGAICDAPNLNCDYPLDPSCMESWTCAGSGGDSGVWTSLGVACAEPGRD